MAKTTITLSLTSTKPAPPTLPGQSSESSVLVNGGPPSSPSNYSDLKKSDGSIVEWTYTRGSTGWQKDTWLVTLVFGLAGPASLGSFNAHTIFKPPAAGSSIQRDTKNSWAQPANTVGGSAFTFMVKPGATATTTWSLQADWTNVENCPLLQSSGSPPNGQYLDVRFRTYFYTTTFGLWYVDPELDLCP